MADSFDAVVQRYHKAFGEWPASVAGITEERLIELMQKALEKGAPIADEDYYSHLPSGSVA